MALEDRKRGLYGLGEAHWGPLVGSPLGPGVKIRVKSEIKRKVLYFLCVGFLKHSVTAKGYQSFLLL